MLQKCRPDWDICKPELKSEWAKGDKSSFYPYGQTMKQVFADQDK